MKNEGTRSPIGRRRAARTKQKQEFYLRATVIGFAEDTITCAIDESGACMIPSKRFTQGAAIREQIAWNEGFADGIRRGQL